VNKPELPPGYTGYRRLQVISDCLNLVSVFQGTPAPTVENGAIISAYTRKAVEFDLPIPNWENPDFPALREALLALKMLTLLGVR